MRNVNAIILTTASLVLSSATQAQSGAGLLEEILVTAQKRQQQAIDVPIAIGTFSQRDIINTGALNLQDIDAYIVGFDAGGKASPSKAIAFAASLAPTSLRGVTLRWPPFTMTPTSRAQPQPSHSPTSTEWKYCEAHKARSLDAMRQQASST